MSEHALDTLRFAERLEKTGMTREQASEVSKSLGDYMQEKLVTKQDLINLAIKDDLMKFATREELRDLRSEMRWLFGLTITILSILMTALKFFH